jgi:tagatose 1,6-diphosphate aldolase
MSKVKLSRGKFEGINACADERGIIAAAAMDQRGSLQKAIAKARGENGTASEQDMVQFKIAVTKVLTRHASAILMDPEFGLEALKHKDPKAGVYTGL